MSVSQFGQVRLLVDFHTIAHCNQPPLEDFFYFLEDASPKSVLRGTNSIETGLHKKDLLSNTLGKYCEENITQASLLQSKMCVRYDALKSYLGACNLD